jgi:hypothetical protein
MLPRQLYACIVLSLLLLMLIVRLVQKGRLDIAYCWLWLCIGVSTLVVVLRNDLLKFISSTIGAVSDTTTVFLLGFFLIVLMCLQFSLVISLHRRQIKKLYQKIALLSNRVEQLSNKNPDQTPQT